VDGWFALPTQLELNTTLETCTDVGSSQDLGVQVLLLLLLQQAVVLVASIKEAPHAELPHLHSACHNGCKHRQFQPALFALHFLHYTFSKFHGQERKLYLIYTSAP
jgi:hypothetical protein